MKSIIILCGGRGKRMGQDKGLLIINGIPLILRIIERAMDVADEVILVLRDENQFKNYEKILENLNFISKNLLVSFDFVKDQGPLMGIYTGLKQVSSKQVLIVPCDSPLISRSFMEKMLNYNRTDFDVIVPQWFDGRLEPLHAIYNKNIADKINYLLNDGKKDVKSLFKLVKVKYVEVESLDKTGKSFLNLNKPEDVNKIAKFLNK